MTTTAKMIEEARRHCSPMYVKLVKPVLRGEVEFKAGVVFDARHYDGAGKFVIVESLAGPMKLFPEDFDVLVWRWWAPLPLDKRRV